MLLIYAIQVLTGGVGGVMCALQIMGTVFETALFMASFGLSGFFLLTHLFMLNENLAAKYPKLGIIVSILHKDLYEKSNMSLKLLPLQHMMYLLLGTVLSLVLTIYRFLAWSLVSVRKLNYMCRVSFYVSCVLIATLSNEPNLLFLQICLWILLIAFIVDLVDRFRQYR